MNAALKQPVVAALDPVAVRRDFPIFSHDVNGKKLVFLDSAASAQKPRAVVEAIRHVYEDEYANVHRGVYWLSQRATDAFEGAREKVRGLLNAASEKEIIFVRGATEGINLVAQTWGRQNLKPGDEILITAMEHHSNIVPWQMLRDEKGIVLKVAPIDDNGELIVAEFRKRLSPRTKLVAITHVANALGTVLPVADLIRFAHEAGALVLVDGCQAVPHMAVDVQALDADFYVFSGHKLYGPSGIGVLYGKQALLEAMPPWQGGGDMIRSVTFEKTEYNDLPYKFEAGTPNIAGAIGLGAAIDYVLALGYGAIGVHEHDLTAYAHTRLNQLPGIRIIGNAREKAGVVSFVMEGVHPHDIGTILDGAGVSVRAGHHCAQPVMDRFNIPATARASFGVYNTREDVDALVAALRRVAEIFA